MKPTPEQLSQLADISLPSPPGLWPPAWGWVLVFLILLTSLVSLIVFLYKKRQARWKQDALVVLEDIKRRQQRASRTKNKPQAFAVLLSELNQLLKRVCLTCYSSDQVSKLQGHEWLNFLDLSMAGRKGVQQKKSTTNQFSKGAGSILKHAQYQSQLTEKELKGTRWTALFDLCETWLQKQSLPKPIPPNKGGQ